MNPTPRVLKCNGIPLRGERADHLDRAGLTSAYLVYLTFIFSAIQLGLGEKPRRSQTEGENAVQHAKNCISVSERCRGQLGEPADETIAVCGATCRRHKTLQFSPYFTNTTFHSAWSGVVGESNLHCNFPHRSNWNLL